MCGLLGSAQEGQKAPDITRDSQRTWARGSLRWLVAEIHAATDAPSFLWCWPVHSCGSVRCATSPEAFFSWRVPSAFPQFLLLSSTLLVCRAVWFWASYLVLVSHAWASHPTAHKGQAGIFVPSQKVYLWAICRDWPAESTAIFKAFCQSSSKRISLWPFSFILSNPLPNFDQIHLVF